jgi:hypothetical protein
VNNITHFFHAIQRANEKKAEELASEVMNEFGFQTMKAAVDFLADHMKGMMDVRALPLDKDFGPKKNSKTSKN